MKTYNFKTISSTFFTTNGTLRRLQEIPENEITSPLFPSLPMKFILLISLFFTLAWGDESNCLPTGVINLGKERLVYGKDTVEVDVHMDKQKMLTVFRKSGNGVTIDSIVNSDGSYYVYEQRQHVKRQREETGEQTIYIYDNKNKLIQIFSIGKEKKRLYDDKGALLPLYKEIRGDTVFWDLEYKNDGMFIN